jgi:hypothetical protein
LNLEVDIHLPEEKPFKKMIFHHPHQELLILINISSLKNLLDSDNNSLFDNIFV